MLDVEVFDFDGPFDEATSLGHAEVNFVRNNISDLADVWVTLHGKLAQACQSKLHLRIFLDNTKGSNVAKEYISKMEKEVGKKVNHQFPTSLGTIVMWVLFISVCYSRTNSIIIVIMNDADKYKVSTDKFRFPEAFCSST